MLKRIICVALIGLMLGGAALSECCFGEFSTSDLNGNRVTESVFSRNTVTMVTVWATWSDYCTSELSILEEVYENLPGGAGLVTFCYDAPEESTLALELLGGAGARYPALLITGDIYDRFLYRTCAFPTTFFVNSDGEMLGSPIEGSAGSAAACLQALGACMG